MSMFGKLRDIFRRRPVPIVVEMPPRLLGAIKKGRPAHRKLPPALPGNYRIVHIKTGVITYYGTTNDLRRRPKEHKRSGLYDPAVHLFVWQLANAGATAIARYAHEKK